MPEPIDEFEGFVEQVLNEPTRESRPVSTAAKLQPIPVVTAPVFVAGRRRMERMLPAVSATRVIGSGLLQDASTALRDAVGGRAGAIETAIAQQLQALQTDIRQRATAAGAHAVVSFAVQLSAFGDRLTILIATGTPVILSPEA